LCEFDGEALVVATDLRGSWDFTSCEKKVASNKEDEKRKQNSEEGFWVHLGER
jgi:hypothetical protein